MKRLKILSFGFSLIFLFTFSAFADQHPKIPLLDENGDNVIELAKQNGQKLVINGVTYLKGHPYSPEQTCGSCHDYDAITKAYHFQIGATEVSDDFGKKHPQFHDPFMTSPGQFGSW